MNAEYLKGIIDALGKRQDHDSILAAQLLTSLENENRELRRDKERLDWIEENANDTKGLLVAGICYWSVTKGKERLSEGDDLRDAIDEAMDKSLTNAATKEAK